MSYKIFLVSSLGTARMISGDPNWPPRLSQQLFAPLKRRHNTNSGGRINPHGVPLPPAEFFDQNTNFDLLKTSKGMKPADIETHNIQSPKSVMRKIATKPKEMHVNKHREIRSEVPVNHISLIKHDVRKNNHSSMSLPESASKATKDPTLEQLDMLLRSVTNQTVAVDVNQTSAFEPNSHHKNFWARNALNLVAWLAVVHMVILFTWVYYATRVGAKTSQDSLKSARSDSADSLQSESSLMKVFKRFDPWRPKINMEPTPERSDEIVIPPLNLHCIERDTSSVPKYIPSGDSDVTSDICSTLRGTSIYPLSEVENDPIIHVHQDPNTHSTLTFTASSLRFPSFLKLNRSNPSKDSVTNKTVNEEDRSATSEESHVTNSQFATPTSVSCQSQQSQSGASDPASSVKVRLPNGLVISTTADKIPDVSSIVSETARQHTRATDLESIDDLSDDISDLTSASF